MMRCRYSRNSWTVKSISKHSMNGMNCFFYPSHHSPTATRVLSIFSFTKGFLQGANPDLAWVDLRVRANKHAHIRTSVVEWKIKET